MYSNIRNPAGHESWTNTSEFQSIEIIVGPNIFFFGLTNDNCQ
jgi:hypothetical protein